MSACPACGEENPWRAKFCLECGAPLTEIPAAPALEERKVVSILFCDLVGFTASSEAADPEDVRARLAPYHALLRSEIEHHGGTVEKFVGDAVMAAFGAPVSHEDDAERAVRAGLRILEAIAELNGRDPALQLQVRIGINTGEGLVSLGAKPNEGEGFVTGDVVNTASRLQGAAPVNGIACSESTYRQTERIFDYEPLAPVSVKGKHEPLALHQPRRARARFGSDITRTHTTPLVGRELEKPLLIGTFERAASQRSCQLVTIVGEPGVGKSRLCAELFHYIEQRPGLVRWRQGRCLPYGEGIAFWALGEVVKAECGILESDSPEQAQAKLERALPLDDPDLPWLRARLLPLVGAGGEPASQEESFTAWRRVLESLAHERETVLVFEDMHWADAALLSFLEHLADWSEGVPLLLLCTARPELYERHPAWAAGLRNATTINLAPLTDEETATLVSTLLERAVLPAQTQQVLLERSGGNPLYAEEFVRLLQDRGELHEALEVPDSLQALIAARLDTLFPERKSLLQDASVIGKVFWAGALVEMGGREPGRVEQALHELARKELVRPARSSSMAGEAEYGFWHGLVRDVCYAQIPRAARAARHRAAAAWIEQKAAERAEDLADVLASHYLSALELSRAAGQREEVQELEASAIRYLALAAERSLPLDVTSAEESLAKALALVPEGHPERPELLVRWADATAQAGHRREADQALEQLLTSLCERAEPVVVARALQLRSRLAFHVDRVRPVGLAAEAVELLEQQPPGGELVAAYAQLANAQHLAGLYPETIATADHAYAVARELGLPEPARALGYRGFARAYLGDADGLAEMERALALLVGQGAGRDAAVLQNNLAIARYPFEGPARSLAGFEQGIAFCEERGLAEAALVLEANVPDLLRELGRTEEAIEHSARLAGVFEAGGDTNELAEVRSAQLSLRLARGEHVPPAEVEWLIATARTIRSPEGLILEFSAAAAAAPKQASALLAELEQARGVREPPYYARQLPVMVRAALAAGDPGLARRLTDGLPSRYTLDGHALCAARAQLAEAVGEHAEAAVLYAEAVERWSEFGNVPERAYALLGQGRCLVVLAEPGAVEPLRKAAEIFSSMGYAPALAETEAQLARAS